MYYSLASVCCVYTMYSTLEFSGIFLSWNGLRQYCTLLYKIYYTI